MSCVRSPAVNGVVVTAKSLLPAASVSRPVWESWGAKFTGLQPTLAHRWTAALASSAPPPITTRVGSGVGHPASVRANRSGAKLAPDIVPPANAPSEHARLAVQAKWPPL